MENVKVMSKKDPQKRVNTGRSGGGGCGGGGGGGRDEANKTKAFVWQNQFFGEEMRMNGREIDENE
jgi:hypothetical protein